MQVVDAQGKEVFLVLLDVGLILPHQCFLKFKKGSQLWHFSTERHSLHSCILGTVTYNHFRTLVFLRKASPKHKVLSKTWVSFRKSVSPVGESQEIGIGDP